MLNTSNFSSAFLKPDVILITQILELIIRLTVNLLQGFMHNQYYL